MHFREDNNTDHAIVAIGWIRLSDTDLIDIGVVIDETRAVPVGEIASAPGKAQQQEETGNG